MFLNCTFQERYATNHLGVNLNHTDLTFSHVLMPPSTSTSLATVMLWSQSSVGVLDGTCNMT